jgi:ABC-2 type transport system ATP-binding protein
MIAIQTRDLTKKYGEKTAVNSLNISINQGELFGLLGVNGAGKTTTIKMLSCLTRPTSGDATILGHSILKGTNKVKEVTNVSPQETAVAPNLSVRENIEMIAGIYGMNKATAAEKTIEIMKTMDLTQIKDNKAKTLSGGWQRRLSIAMALVSGPQILFLDEPTLSLDVLARRELWSTITGLKGKVTIILTTHYMEEAEALSDRVGIMTHGQLKVVGTPTELITLSGKNSFEEAFIKFAAPEEVLL